MVKRDLYTCINNNIPILEEWCGLKYKEVLFDSEINGKSSEIFRKNN